MFSVVVPLYNKELSISKTISLVLEQTFHNFEIIIVNDGSTDKSLEKLNFFNDNRIRVIHQENSGVSKARNKGVKNAKYDWIVFLDADDWWLEDHLSVIKNMIDNHKNFFVFCSSYIISSEFKNIESNNDITIVKNYFKESINNFFFWTSAACIHKNVFKEVGLFRDELSIGEDLEMWVRIGRVYPIVKSSKITALYNLGSENKLTRKKISLKKHYVNYLNFENIEKDEFRYLKWFLFGTIKSIIKKMNFIVAFKLFKKYHKILLFNK